MSHTYEKVSGNKAKLSFVIPAEKFDEALQLAFLKLRKRINVPGFRRGKAPRRMIETIYGESVFYDDAFEIVSQDAYSEAIKEYDLHPVDRPQADIDEIGAGKDLKFHVEVFVRPDVTLGEYKGLTVEADLQKLTDEMVDARIEEDRNKASRTIDVEDRPVQEGDTVNLDYAGSVDGVPFAGINESSVRILCNETDEYFTAICAEKSVFPEYIELREWQGKGSLSPEGNFLPIPNRLSETADAKDDDLITLFDQYSKPHDFTVKGIYAYYLGKDLYLWAVMKETMLLGEDEYGVDE